MTTTNITPEVDPKEHWLQERKKFIGGSDSASLFPEDSRYGCTTRLWFDKTGTPTDYPRTEKDEQILKRGQIWEDIVALYFSEYTGMKVRRIGQRVSKRLPIMGVNMDRQIIGVTTEQLKAAFPNSAEIQAMEGECGPGYLECKSANPYVYKKMLKEGVPNDYVMQVNHGLAVTGYKWGVFAVLEPAFGDFSAFPYVFKPNLAAEQENRAQHFQYLVSLDKPPMPTVIDQRCKSCLWRKSCPRYDEVLAQSNEAFTDKEYVADESLAELVADYREADKVATEKQATVDAIKDRIREQMGSREKVAVPSLEARIQYVTGKPPMRWDSKALEGTVQVLVKFDIPEDAACMEEHEQPVQAKAIAEVSERLVYVCEVCAAKALKAGYQIVARKEAWKVVSDCKRAGEPSRPLKIVLPE